MDVYNHFHSKTATAVAKKLAGNPVDLSMVQNFRVSTDVLGSEFFTISSTGRIFRNNTFNYTATAFGPSERDFRVEKNVQYAACSNTRPTTVPLPEDSMRIDIVLHVRHYFRIYKIDFVRSITV